MLQINGRRPEIIALVASTEHGNWSEDRRSSIIVSVHVVPCKLSEKSETVFSYLQIDVTDDGLRPEDVTTNQTSSTAARRGRSPAASLHPSSLFPGRRSLISLPRGPSEPN